MAHATAEDQPTTAPPAAPPLEHERVERHVEIVTPERRPFLVAWLLFATVAVVITVVAVAITGAIDSEPEAVDALPEGALEGAIHWRAELATAAFPAAVDHDEGIVLAGHDGRPNPDRPSNLVAMNLATGRELWRSTVRESLVDAHGFTGEIAVATAVVDENDPVDAIGFDVRTGKELWRQTLGQRAPDPVALDDVILLGGAALFAVDPPTGRQAWRADVAVHQRPTVRDGIAYVVAPGQLAAVEVDDGDIRWVHPLDNVAAYSSPAVLHEELVIAANLLGEVIALDRDSGRVVWSVLTDTGSEPEDPNGRAGVGALGVFGPSGGRVFVGTADRRLIAFDADTGQDLWSRPTDLDFTEPVVAPAGDTVVIGGDDETEVVAIDAATGVERWRFETGDTIPPLVRDGRAYLLDVRAADAAHDLVALDLETGVKRWQVELEHPAFGAMVYSDGLLLIPTVERGAGTTVIYAVR